MKTGSMTGDEQEARLQSIWRKAKLMFIVIIVLLAVITALLCYSMELEHTSIPQTNMRPVLSGAHQIGRSSSRRSLDPYLHAPLVDSSGKILSPVAEEIYANKDGNVTTDSSTADASSYDPSSDPDDFTNPYHVPDDFGWTHTEESSNSGESKPQSWDVYHQKSESTSMPAIDSTGTNSIEEPVNELLLSLCHETVCMSPGCVRAAARILENIDTKTQPCDDFYQFACGRYIETHEVPDGKSQLTPFSLNQDDINGKLRILIERPHKKDDPPILRQIRNMYASCMNLDDIEARGDKPLRDLLHLLGGWPALGAKSNSTGYWLDTLIKFRQFGLPHDILIDISVEPDMHNSLRHIIQLDQPSLGLPDRSYYFRGVFDKTVAGYVRLMVEATVMLGARPEEARQQMSEVFEFEQSLAKISVPKELRRNETLEYNKMLLGDLYRLTPSIDWLHYLTAVLRDKKLSLDKDEVNVKVPEYFRSLEGLLKKTSARIIHNYLIWRVVRHASSGLNRRWRDLENDYTTTATGVQANEARWEQCLGSMSNKLGVALAALYVRNHFDEQSKFTASQMLHYVREDFLKTFDEIDWMDEETKELAKLKAKGIEPFIGYPKELLQDNLVEDLYKGLNLSTENYYENLKTLHIWSTDDEFSRLRKPNERRSWKKHAKAAIANAYYDPAENSIEFPAGILLGAFFDAHRPSYMNFGAIGDVIGHEMTHAFDDRGRQFDKDGNVKNWWNPKTDKRFRERAACIVEQYGNYSLSLNGPKVNGINTQGENIADNGGIKRAYRAYKHWVKDYGPERRLPGLDYSVDQLFWISAASIWCGKTRPEQAKLRITTDVHSPARFRVNGPFSNLHEFAQSFNCPIGSPMNPAKKCSVW